MQCLVQTKIVSRLKWRSWWQIWSQSLRSRINFSKRKKFLGFTRNSQRKLKKLDWKRKKSLKGSKTQRRKRLVVITQHLNKSKESKEDHWQVSPLAERETKGRDPSKWTVTMKKFCLSNSIHSFQTTPLRKWEPTTSTKIWELKRSKINEASLWVKKLKSWTQL